jgi:hypothetical protein
MSAQTPSAGAAGASPELRAAPVAPGEPRDPDLVLARLHLLLGSLSLARTELEMLAGQGALDDEAIRDLAETRWRTGDLGGAGEAATAWLEGHPDDILGLVIAAESQAALGRPSEARRLAGLAMDAADGTLDPIFAGMQRSSIWPAEAGAAVGPVGVLFDDLHPGPHAVPPLPPASASAAIRPSVGRPAGDGVEPFEPGIPAGLATGPSLWGDDAAGIDAAAGDLLDPTVLFHGARVALEAGQPAEAATGLILALRASPGLAPAVLDLLAGRGEPILALVRGDAQRIVGREVEAMRDHAEAAGGVASADAAHGHHAAEAEPGSEAEPEAESEAESDVQSEAETQAEPGADLDADPPTPVQENS